MYGTSKYNFESQYTLGLLLLQISRWQSKKNTYGWARAEVLGALVNAVFLIALCFTIFVEALQRMAHDEHIKDPKLMLIVGGLGLAINLVGLCLFSGHGWCFFSPFTPNSPKDKLKKKLLAAVPSLTRSL